MNSRNKIIMCIIINAVLLVGVIIVVSVFSSSESKYWNTGYSDELIIISVKIDTLSKYITLLIGLALINITRVLVEEIGIPVLSFNVFNPDKKIITEFTKNELNIFTNAMWMISAVRGVIMTVISVTQIDIALFGVFISEVASIFTVRMLLNEKQFIREGESQNDASQLELGTLLADKC